MFHGYFAHASQEEDEGKEQEDRERRFARPERESFPEREPYRPRFGGGDRDRPRFGGVCLYLPFLSLFVLCLIVRVCLLRCAGGLGDEERKERKKTLP